VRVIKFKSAFSMCLLLTVKGELEQSKKSVAAAAAATISLRSRRNEKVTKKVLCGGEKRSTRAVSGSSSALPAGSGAGRLSLRSSKTLLPRQVSTKSFAKPHSNSAVRSSTWLKRTAPQLHAAGTKSSSVKSPASAVDMQESDTTQTLPAGDGTDSKISQNSRSSGTTTASSPMSTRTRSMTSSSPAQFNRNVCTVRTLPVRTYGRKHAVDKIEASKELWSTASGQNLSTTADADSSLNKHGTCDEVVKIPNRLRSEASSAVSSDEDSRLQTGLSDRSPPKRHNVAVQADIPSSPGSSCLIRLSALHSRASSVASVSPSRHHSNLVMESCGSGKTALTPVSASQYDTCFETASSQLQNTEDTDDEDLDQLARLAHGSPQSMVVRPASEDESATDHAAATVEQRTYALTISTDKPSTVDTRRTASVGDDTSDSGGSSPVKKRRTKIGGTKENEQSPKSSRAPSQLAGGGNKLVESASGTNSVVAVSSQHHDKWKRSGKDVSSSRVDSSSMEPVAGPSGIARRTTRSQNVYKQKSRGSGKN